MQAIIETIFHPTYLISVTIMGMLMIKRAQGDKQFILFGIMAVSLAAGDSFHLVPRLIAVNTTGMEDYVVSLGMGKLVTSITMTIFYILLYHIWERRYQIKDNLNLTVFFYLLAFYRIVLTLYPQNALTTLHPSLAWGIYRNIPFVIMGGIIIVLYFKRARELQVKDFRYVWLAALISFACYIPVVLWAESYPVVGTLMIPKTVAYFWAVWMGFSAQKKHLKAEAKEA